MTMNNNNALRRMAMAIAALLVLCLAPRTALAQTPWTNDSTQTDTTHYTAPEVTDYTAPNVNAKDMPTRKRVYMFGFAASFTDSLAFMTDVIAVDSAYVHKNGFLADRTLYAAQLDMYLQTQMGLNDMTCVVFFNEKRGDLEKKFLKVKKRYQKDQTVRLDMLGADLFVFEAEDYVPAMEYDMPIQKEKPKGGPGGGGPGGGGAPPSGGMGGGMR